VHLEFSLNLETEVCSIFFFMYRLQAEVFSILFVLEQDKKHIVHCLNCACKISPTLENFVILNQYKLEELMEIYDNFQLSSIVSTMLSTN
jgi:hypothetical protein